MRFCKMNNLGETILNHYENYLGNFIGADPYADDNYHYAGDVVTITAEGKDGYKFSGSIKR